MNEVHQLPSQNINRAKEILAYEVTRLAHGLQDAAAAYTASIRQFGLSDPAFKVKTTSGILNVEITSMADIPTIELPRTDLSGGIWIIKLFTEAGLCNSNSEVRRLIQQRGAYLNDQIITDADMAVTEKHLSDGAVLLKAGKKRMKRVLFTAR
jgi:tyrosyl-tRNA synthetase